MTDERLKDLLSDGVEVLSEEDYQDVIIALDERDYEIEGKRITTEMLFPNLPPEEERTDSNAPKRWFDFDLWWGGTLYH